MSTVNQVLVITKLLTKYYFRNIGESDSSSVHIVFFCNIHTWHGLVAVMHLHFYLFIRLIISFAMIEQRRIICFLINC